MFRIACLSVVLVGMSWSPAQAQGRGGFNPFRMMWDAQMNRTQMGRFSSGPGIPADPPSSTSPNVPAEETTTPAAKETKETKPAQQTVVVQIKPPAPAPAPANCDPEVLRFVQSCPGPVLALMPPTSATSAASGVTWSLFSFKDCPKAAHDLGVCLGRRDEEKKLQQQGK